MENTEKQKFEEAWREAFEQAEQTPSDKVWLAVENGLNAVEKKSMKRSIVFYQRLAAATIFFALVMGGITTFYLSDSLKDKSVADISENRNSIPENPGGNNQIDASEISGGSNADLKSTDLVDGEKTNTGRYNQPDNGGAVISNEYKAKTAKADKSNDVTLDRENAKDYSKEKYVGKTKKDIQFASLSDLFTEPDAKGNSKMREVVIVRKLPAMPSVFMANSNKKNKQDENVWASVGASTGNYTLSPDLGSVAGSRSYSMPQSNSSGLSGGTSTSASKGSAFSVGMNMGKRISRKWLVQGGVSYLTQSIGYTSNLAMVSSNNRSYATVADYNSNSSSLSMVSVTNPYQINSLNQFISMPLQAGYLFVDRKLGVQLNSGVSTDFFIQNTLSDKSGQLSTYSTGPGESSPFRTVSWAGLLGTEFSYKLGSSYRFSLVPGLRYSLNSILKSESAASNPLVWDVGFRCRYIFK